ncbi:MAG: hypothetical protein AB7Q29_17095 [Vicinamibacterales bacterium]
MPIAKRNTPARPSAARKIAVTGPKSAGTARKKTTRSKNPGEVLGLGTQKPVRTPIRAAKPTRGRRPKGIEIGPTSERQPARKPARVRG